MEGSAEEGWSFGAVLGCLACGCMAYARERRLQHSAGARGRAEAEEYTLEQHKRPQSLEELVTSGYLKQVPADPMTRRYDSWVLEWSEDPKMPGIVDVHSSSHEIGSDGRAYCDW